eukprot:gene3134-8428_t
MVKHGSHPADVFEYDLDRGVEKPVIVEGDVRVAFFQARMLRGDEHMFHFWVNTHFVRTGTHRFPKPQLDKAVKDSKNEYFSADLTVEATFALPPGSAGESHEPAAGGGLEAGC